jgi:hypothetical protein
MVLAMNGDDVMGEDGKLYDHLTEGGAIVLAERLEAWWAKLGYPSVRTWWERATGKTVRGNLGTVYVVRSNLVNGLPPAAFGLKAVPLKDGSTSDASAA